MATAATAAIFSLLYGEHGVLAVQERAAQHRCAEKWLRSIGLRLKCPQLALLVPTALAALAGPALVHLGSLNLSLRALSGHIWSNVAVAVMLASPRKSIEYTIATAVPLLRGTYRSRK